MIFGIFYQFELLQNYFYWFWSVFIFFSLKKGGGNSMQNIWKKKVFALQILHHSKYHYCYLFYEFIFLSIKIGRNILEALSENNTTFLMKLQEQNVSSSPKLLLMRKCIRIFIWLDLSLKWKMKCCIITLLW